MKKGIEEPWASERVARFINSPGYKEITLKSYTEPEIVWLRVAKQRRWRTQSRETNLQTAWSRTQ